MTIEYVQRADVPVEFGVFLRQTQDFWALVSDTGAGPGVIPGVGPLLAQLVDLC